jgi:hypothetical protein
MDARLIQQFFLHQAAVGDTMTVRAEIETESAADPGASLLRLI